MTFDATTLLPPPDLDDLPAATLVDYIIFLEGQLTRTCLGLESEGLGGVYVELETSLREYEHIALAPDEDGAWRICYPPPRQYAEAQREGPSYPEASQGFWAMFCLRYQHPLPAPVPKSQ